MKTPRANRKHIGIFGRRNVGKSSFLNALADQEVSLVSDIKGTTTDAVSKSMELPQVGAVVFYDTAGFDDVGTLGQMRVKKTDALLPRMDAALLLYEEWGVEEEDWKKRLEQEEIPYLCIRTKADLRESSQKEDFSIYRKEDKTRVLGELAGLLKTEDPTILGHRPVKDQVFVLVMPQDEQAPKGRLILPQVQTIREILDKRGLAVCVQTEELPLAFSLLKRVDLVICDSQVFKEVNAVVPEEIALTSFSVLFAALKGDEEYFRESLEHLDGLKKGARILILEACTHPPGSEDIGTVKIPALLEKRYPGRFQFEFYRGKDLPEDLGDYDFLIHCGACMYHRAHVLSRVKEAKRLGIPMSNYGMTMAWLLGVLDRVDKNNYTFEENK